LEKKENLKQSTEECETHKEFLLRLGGAKG
jgi:hypothetical protein